MKRVADTRCTSRYGHGSFVHTSTGSHGFDTRSRTARLERTSPPTVFARSAACAFTDVKLLRSCTLWVKCVAPDSEMASTSAINGHAYVQLILPRAATMARKPRPTSAATINATGTLLTVKYWLE